MKKLISLAAVALATLGTAEAKIEFGNGFGVSTWGGYALQDDVDIWGGFGGKGTGSTPGVFGGGGGGFGGRSSGQPGENPHSSFKPEDNFTGGFTFEWPKGGGSDDSEQPDNRFLPPSEHPPFGGPGFPGDLELPSTPKNEFSPTIDLFVNDAGPTAEVTPVPEPATYGLIASGFLVAAVAWRSRRKFSAQKR
jgi:hypothetical protein